MKVEFKFNLGDRVRHVCQSQHSDPAIILSRCCEETSDGIIKSYMISFYNVGQVQRIKVYDDEIKLEQPEK